jgi:hypothetical protein
MIVEPIEVCGIRAPGLEIEIPLVLVPPTFARDRAIERGKAMSPLQFVQTDQLIRAEVRQRFVTQATLAFNDMCREMGVFPYGPTEFVTKDFTSTPKVRYFIKSHVRTKQAPYEDIDTGEIIKP